MVPPPVFITWRRAAFLMLLAAGTFFFLIFFSHISFIMQMVSGQAGLPGTRIEVFANAWYWSFQDLSAPQRIINTLAAILFAVNIMSIFYVIRIQRAAFVSIVSLLSMGGIVSAFLGLLCVSCGSLFIILIPSLLSLSTIYLLPFRGLEFNVLGICMLGMSLWIMYRKLSLFRK